MKKLGRLLCLLLVLTMVGSSAMALELQRGSRGVDALFLQLRLNALGYSVGTPDGDYGGKTATAVESFQKDRGLKATGAVDEATWEALFDERITLYASVGSGFNSKTYSIPYNLPAPFTTVERIEGPSGGSDHAKLEVSGMYGDVFIAKYGSLDDFEQDAVNYMQQNFEETFQAQYSGSDYQLNGQERFEINGKPASLVECSCKFVNGEPLTHYEIYGCEELDEFNGVQLYLLAMITFNLPTGTDKVLTSEDVKAALAGARCNRDMLYDYQAGAAEREAAAGVKLDMPEFQPMDDGRRVAELVYPIQKYVDPSADGSSGQFDGNTCVSLYYGAKVMNWYQMMVDAGNDPADVVKEARMSLSVAAMDFDLMHAFPEVKGQFAAAMSAARLALTDGATPYLTAMGIEKPRWSEADLDSMNTGLMDVFDTFIANLEEKGE